MPSYGHHLRSLMVIKHHDQSIVPIVDQQQQAYLRQNLHLILFQAKWALLYRDNTLYHSSLSQLSQWINDYFDQQSLVTKTALANIQILKTVTLQTQLPAPTASLKAFQAIASTQSQHTDTVALTPTPTADEDNSMSESLPPKAQSLQPAPKMRPMQSDQKRATSKQNQQHSGDY